MKINLKYVLLLIDQIKPSGEETFVAVKSMVNDVMAWHGEGGFEGKKKVPKPIKVNRARSL